MGHHRLPARRQEKQLDRLGDRRFGRHVNKCSVAHERGIQRGEGPVQRSGVLAEMLADEILSMRNDVGQTLNVVEERGRERGLKKTVNKNQTVPGLKKQKRPDVLKRRDTSWRFRQ